MITPEDLLRIASTGWGFVERDRVGGWELRASGGFTGRGNSVWPLGDPGLPLDEALGVAEAWFAERGLPPKVVTIVGSDLDRAVEALGYSRAETPALRQTAALAPAHESLRASAPAEREAEITTGLPPDFAGLYQRGKGQEHASTVLASGGADLRFGVVRDGDGRLLACGRLGMMHDEGWASIAALRTAERVRRQGLSRAVLRDLLAVAASAGIANVYLEVEPDNAEARPFYTALGFETHHVYHYRTRPAVDGAAYV